MLPIREVAMLILMDHLTDKQNSHKKVLDDEIVAKLRPEVLTQPEEGLSAAILIDKELDPVRYLCLSDTALY